MRKVILQELGLVDYAEAFLLQEKLFNQVVSLKIENRKAQDISSQKTTLNHLLLCEHPHVYTMGKSGHSEFLLLDEKGLLEKKASFYNTNRGGDITYHGPGQIVGYPIFDLDHFFTDIHRYLRTLEEAVILTLQEYGVAAGRIKEYTGVWIEPGNPLMARKICALGVKCSRWVTMHGFAFNVNPDLAYFDNIIPCGIKDKKVTSLSQELGYEVNLQEVQNRLKINLSNVFDFDFIIP